MKRTIIASIVGGILIFLWQFLSFPILNLHKAAQGYTPNQEAILENLKANLPEEGGYILPNLPETATNEDHEKQMETANGKPWASIQYHKSNESSSGAMTMNMARALLSHIITIMLFCWILKQMNLLTFGKIFIASLFTGLIVFLNSPYSQSIWFDFFDITAHLIDAIVIWALVGLWLGWYLSRSSAR